MKISACVMIVASLLMTACASVVTTYDSNGHTIGSCKAERGAFSGAGAGCSGSANQEGRIR